MPCCRHPRRLQFAAGLCFAVLATLLAGGLGCVRTSSGPEVVVYSALDSKFAQPIFDAFEQETGIHVRAKFDAESTKTVQLTAAILAESETRTRCDLFWNNEILNTLRLDEKGLLGAYRPQGAAAFPAEFRSKQDRWFGFAARARVLIVNTELVAADEMPASIYDLLNPKWKGRIGIAKPLFGSTATHAVCLFEKLGEASAKEFFQGLKQNECQILSGNKQVAQDVARGTLAFGLTDTDDALIELEQGFSVKIVYPDSGPGEMGTLFFPNTIAVLRDGPNQLQARKLADYLLSAQVEAQLAQGPSAQIPLHPDVKIRLRVETPQTVQGMEVDFEAAARRWDTVGHFLNDEFATAR